MVRGHHKFEKIAVIQSRDKDARSAPKNQKTVPHAEHVGSAMGRERALRVRTDCEDFESFV